ncbi:MAG: uridine kinase [Salinivirgaceae bacterium]|jgi:uridine kinase|nr:uridine kinase [Salinivirgaceae bacterium]
MIIGIAGGTGSGKTTVVRKIIESIPMGEVSILSQDSYYKDNSHLPLEDRININFDHPQSVEFDLLVDHIKKLEKGKAVNQPIYSYVTCTRQEEYTVVQPRKVILVEGILVLTNPQLRNMFDIKVFVHADADERLIRVIRRDLEERGRSIEKTLERYNNSVKPMHQQFIEPSKSHADLIVPQGGENKVAIDILTQIIKMNLK